MLRSMTGFGEASGEVDGAQYSVEIRSVNNRYCKCVLRLPEICSPAEPEIEKILRSRLRRGMIFVGRRDRGSPPPARGEGRGE